MFQSSKWSYLFLVFVNLCLPVKFRVFISLLDNKSRHYNRLFFPESRAKHFIFAAMFVAF